MSEENLRGVHWSFWLIGVLTLLWNGATAANFFMQMNPEVLATYPKAEQAIVNGRPLWATVAFAIGALGGVLGSLHLLLRKKIAYYFFLAALAGVLVTIVHNVNVARSGVEFGPPMIAGTVVMPILLAAFLVWYAQSTRRKGWLS